MSLGGDDRFSGAQGAHPNQPDDGTARTARIIPLRTTLDASSASVDGRFVKFADEEAPASRAKIAEPPPVAPSLREEGKSPAPGSTVVIEQPVPAPPLLSAMVIIGFCLIAGSVGLGTMLILLIPGLKVLARSTVFRFKKNQDDPRQIGQTLQVSAVLTGRITQRGDDLHIHAELVDAADGSEIWGSHYECKTADVTRVQGQITRDLSTKLRRINPAIQTQKLGSAGTSNPEAYRLYLEARQLWYGRTPSGLRKSIDLFHQAIAADPNYALAYAGLADTSLMLAVDPRLVRTDRLQPGAKLGSGDGVNGDPRRSSAELGQLGVDLIVTRTADAIKRATGHR